MDRVRRLIFSFCLALVAGFFAQSALASCAGPCSTEAEAYAYCQSHMNSPPTPPVCYLEAGTNSATYNAQCAALGPNTFIFSRRYAFSFNGGSLHIPFCVPPSCSGSFGDGWSTAVGYSSVPPTDDYGGCCITYVSSGSRVVTYGSGAQFTDDKGTSTRNGSYCAHDYASSNNQKYAPHTVCDNGQVSCYKPDGTACYQTESGETVCRKVDPGNTGCSAGATGAVCSGSGGAAPPPPSDPPISSGSPPNGTVNVQDKDSGGNVTNNTTVNNYSGTSDGGGSGSPGAPTSSPQSGGSGSNANGSGNSGSGNGTDSSGKCANGSVPTASGCSGTYTDNGCDTPPVCFGDAVMCGNNREVHAIKCNTAKMAASASSSGVNYGDPSSALVAAGVPGDGGASGDPSASGLVSSSDLGQDGFDASGLGFSRTCPANPVFNVLGRSYELDLNPFCNFASLLGWFVLLIASLVGLRIVATGKA